MSTQDSLSVSAPAVFQRAMDTILQGIPHVICYIYRRYCCYKGKWGRAPEEPWPDFNLLNRMAMLMVSLASHSLTYTLWGTVKIPQSITWLNWTPFPFRPQMSLLLHALTLYWVRCCTTREEDFQNHQPANLHWGILPPLWLKLTSSEHWLFHRADNRNMLSGTYSQSSRVFHVIFQPKKHCDLTH